MRAAAGITDPAARAIAAHRLVQVFQAAGSDAVSIRREAVMVLRGEGMSHAEIAALLGVSRSTAQSIAND